MDNDKLTEDISETMYKEVCSAKTDWNKVRIDASIAAMQALCNSCHDSVIREIQESLDKERSSVISFLAVRIADSLVSELMKKNQYE